MARLIKTKEEIDGIRASGQHLARILKELITMVEPGMNTATLEERALELIQEIGARPAFKGFRPDRHSEPFPSALCTALNEEIVHAPAVPGRILEQGSIITLDIGIEYPVPGYFSDMAVTLPVGKVSKEVETLVRGTEEALAAGIEIMKPGVTLLELGTAIEAVLKKYKLGIIRELVGHGVGLAVHEEPQVPNYAFPKGEFPNITLEAGMVLAVEPMATLGGWRIKPTNDGFTYATADDSLSAHTEHTILITPTGCEILTQIV